MPSYIHAWCSDCVRKSSGCGYQCSKLTDAVGPPRCADACMSSMPGVDQFSKATSNNSTFTTLARGLQITFSGVQLTGPFGTWTLPDFGCGGTYSPGHCQSTRCADIRYASDSLGEGCDIYLPDGYASHSDGPSGSGTDHATCTCGPGGGTGDCVQTVTSPLAYATLVDKWYVDTAASSENPAFFCEMSKPLCLATDYCENSGSCGSSQCKPTPHWWGLYAMMDGNVAGAPSGGGTSSTAASWPASVSKILIRQTAADKAAGLKPMMYVSVLFQMFLIDIGSEPSDCSSDWPSGKFEELNPYSWRITWAGRLSEDCACLQDVTLTTLYSSSFADAAGTAESCSCEYACCTRDIEGVDATGCTEEGAGACEDYIDNWCDSACGDVYQQPPCSTSTNHCWPVCTSQGYPSYEWTGGSPGSGDFVTHGAIDEYTNQDSPENPPCATATCLTDCDKTRSCKNSSGSFWNASFPNQICDTCSGGDTIGSASEASGCTYSDQCGCGTTIGSIVNGWPTASGTWDYTAGSNYTVSAAGSVAITVHS